jgi:general stress protein YciG
VGYGRCPSVDTEEQIMTTSKSGSKRGFAAMSPEKQREIAAKGGRASHGGGRRPSGKSRGSSTR